MLIKYGTMYLSQQFVIITVVVLDENNSYVPGLAVTVKDESRKNI